MLGRAEGAGVDDDRAGLGRSLDAWGGVHHVPHRQRLALRDPGPNERLAGGDADADVEREPGVGGGQLGDAVPHGEGRAQRTLGIVLVGDRRAEERDDRVADELLHGAVALELTPHPVVERHEARADVLRVATVALRRRADEVDEDRRDETPLPSPFGSMLRSNGKPQPRQKRARSGFSSEHRGQRVIAIDRGVFIGRLRPPSERLPSS
jgi:hypothetical protein